MIKHIVIVIMVALLTSCGLKVNNFDLSKAYETGKSLATIGSDATKTYSLEEELAIGKSLSAHLLGASKYYDNEQVQRYVSNVGHWLVQHLPDNPYQWQFVVLEDEVFNAYAAPGGFVFINTGLLEMLHSEAQLAAVLAHEIIHTYRRHHIRAIQSSLRTKIGADTFAFFASLSRHRNADQLAEVFNSINNQVAEIYFLKGFERDYEDESDLLGLKLMAKAGYDPYAMIEMLQVIESYEADNTWMQQFFDTHRRPRDRIVEVMNLLDNELATVNPVANLRQRYLRNKPRTANN
jgi:beta-barrel assembly-enhancing protease